MRLRLSQEKDVALLEVLDDLNVDSVPVLRAGITKLLQTGKHKIALSLTDANQLAPEAILEIAKFQALASELKGEIVLVGRGDLVRQALKDLSPSPAIRCFSTREVAISALQAEAEALAPDAAAATISLEATLPELEARLVKLKIENEKLKNDLKTGGARQLRELRFENGALQASIAAAEELLSSLSQRSKESTDADQETQAKIEQIEATLSSFLSQEGLLGK